MNLGHKVVGLTPIKDVKIPDSFYNRLKTGNVNMDCIFGEGILPGSTISIEAPGGVGKTSFCLTLAQALHVQGYKVGYTSGEESAEQIAYSGKERIKADDVPVGTVVNCEDVLELMDNLDFLVIDSFQSIQCPKEYKSIIKRAEYIVNNVVKKAKDRNCALIFICQITATGTIKGGPIITHGVDVNLKMFRDDEGFVVIENYKNRMGCLGAYKATNDVNGFTCLGAYDGELKELSEKPKKEPIAEIRKQKILDKITGFGSLDDVMHELEISKQVAENHLRELVNENKLVKIGRGAYAVWKKRNATRSDLIKCVQNEMKKINT